ncbi:hypothetical protein EMCRGX_G021142 [Ephydatia muelleri]
MASRASLSEHDSVIANINAVDVAVVFGNGKRAFECVLKYLRECDALEIRQAAIHCLCVVVIPNTPASETLTMVREIQPHVIEICTSATARYRHIIQNTSASGNATDAELVAKFLQACIQSLSQCSQLLRTKVQSEELLPSMLMVIETSLAVGEACFSLCQWVEQQFSHTAKGLSQLFTSTCSLLKLSMEHLDLVSFGSCSDILVESIKAIIARLQLVCKVVMCFDASLMFLTWKGLGKLVCGAKPLLDSNWMVQPLVANLCAAVEAKARECIQCAPIGQETPCSSYSKLLKVCRFLATLLVKLVREFEDLSYEFCADIVHLLVTVHSVCPPSSLAKEVAPAIAQDVDTNVLILREPLISTLLQSPPFLLRLVRGTDVQKSQHFGWALCLSSLAKFFSKLSDGMKDQLMEADSSQEGRSTSCPVLDAFFSCMRECYVDLRVPILLPGVMCNGQAQSPVTLYDHICTHLCTLVTSLSARHYNQLEVVLLKNLLGEDPYCSLLASDVWCFLARWGTNETCIQHVHLLANLLLKLPQSSSSAYLALCSLIRRLFLVLSLQAQASVLFPLPHHSFSFTPPSLSNAQMSVVESFSPVTPFRIKLWACLDLGSLPSAQSELSSCCVAAIMEELCKDAPNQTMLHEALQGLSSLRDLSVAQVAAQQAQNTIAAALMQLLVAMRQGKLTVAVACDVIRLFPLVLGHLPPQEYKTVCSNLCELAEYNPPLPVALELTSFLSQCGGLQIPTHLQSDVLQCLVGMFQCLLGHRDWLVHHHALEAFRSFAELTPFGEVVEQCIPHDMTEAVVSFLHTTPRRPYQDTLSDRDLLIHILTERHKFTTSMESNVLLTTPGTGVTCPPCLEDMALHNAIGTMKANWEQVIASHNKLTPTNIIELRTLCQSILQYIDGNT